MDFFLSVQLHFTINQHFFAQKNEHKVNNSHTIKVATHQSKGVIYLCSILSLLHFS